MAGKWALALAAAALASAQGTAPRKSAADYSAHTALQYGFSLGADYLVHSIPSHHGSFVVDDYLVLEVAIFGTNGAHLSMNPDQFSLRISGAKAPIPAEAPGVLSSGITVTQAPARPEVNDTDDADMSLQDRIANNALPQGEVKTPFAGLLYFSFHGKMKSIKSMDLLYDGPAGKVVLKVF